MNFSECILSLTNAEHDQIGEIIKTLGLSRTVELDNDTILRIHMASVRLPERLVYALLRFRRDPNPYGTLVIRNLPIDDELPSLPTDGSVSSNNKESYVSESSLLLNMVMLGDPIGYMDEKSGALIHNIFPVLGDEEHQENTGSVYFEFHTENGFHPFKPDHLGLLCLRSDHLNTAQTTCASIDRALPMLPNQAINALRRSEFVLRASSSFLKYALAGQSYEATVAVLDGNLLHPEMRLDNYLMNATTAEGEWALALLRTAMEKVMVGHVLEPGDLMIIDNNKAIHGRTAFTPRYDGHDRWLQRLSVVSDIHSSVRGLSGTWGVRLHATAFHSLTWEELEWSKRSQSRSKILLERTCDLNLLYDKHPC